MTDPDAAGYDPDCVVRGAILTSVPLLPDTALDILFGHEPLPLGVLAVMLVGASRLLVARRRRA